MSTERDEWKKKAKEHGSESVVNKAPTIEEFSIEFLQWVDSCHSIRPETKKFYRRGVAMLNASTLAGRRLDVITNDDCEMTDFPGGAYTANKALRTLRRMLTKAKDKKRIFGELPKIIVREVEGRSVAMTIEDTTAIAAKMPDGTPKDVFIVLRSSGMRPSECYAMRWENLHWDGAFFQNPKGKT